jgi:hypothetical protein
MRPLSEMDTIQIELTSACVLRCSNCTRFCGTHKVPFFLEEAEFTAAIDSLVEFARSRNGIVGFMGGEPLLHPHFEEFCAYASARIPRSNLGLWSTFPPKFRRYRELICQTFGVVLLNDHSRDDIMHAPVLMAAEDYFRMPCPQCHGRGRRDAASFADGAVVDPPPCLTCNGSGQVVNEPELYSATERCWVQESWSACINPKGAWFCEVAGALSDLYDGPQGWAVEPGWWKHTTKDFAAQREWACRRCGAALPIRRIRNSQDATDDVSPSSLERLKAIGSRKFARGEYMVRQFDMDKSLTAHHGYPNQTYKDQIYRRGIAERYGIHLRLSSRGYWEPLLAEGAPSAAPPSPPNPFPIYDFSQPEDFGPTTPSTPVLK